MNIPCVSLPDSAAQLVRAFGYDPITSNVLDQIDFDTRQTATVFMNDVARQAQAIMTSRYEGVVAVMEDTYLQSTLEQLNEEGVTRVR